MFRRIIAILRRDFTSMTRDAILIYVAVMPILLSFGLRFFLPNVGQASVQVVVTEETATRLENELAAYLEVEVVADEVALERRVLAYDDAVGIVPAGSGYELLLGGNESHDARVLPAMVLQRLQGESGFVAKMEEVGEAGVPYRQWIGAFVALSVSFLASIIMGLHIIEDKETGMMQALGVTPLQRRTYVLARGLFVVGMALVAVFSSLLALGLTDFAGGQMVAATLASSLAAVLFGFVLGAASGNQITGIANLKFGFLLVLLPAVLTILLPEGWHVALYWLPSYWAFAGFRAILVEGTSWAGLAPLLLGNVAVSLVYLLGSYPWLRGRLNFAAG